VIAVACLGLGAGAIAQVIGQISRQIKPRLVNTGRLASAHVLLGLAAGFAIMYVTGMLVG
jgi:hypothetical protein